MTPNSSTGNASRRRSNRASVKFRLRGVYVRSAALAEQDIKALNISEFGLGLDVAAIRKLPTQNETFEAKLLVGRIATLITLRFVHANSLLAGFEFQAPPELIQGVIGAIFQPELIGTALRPVSALEAGASRYSDGRHSAIEYRLGPGGGLSTLLIQILGTEVIWEKAGILQHVINERKEPVSDFIRNTLIRLIQNASAIPELERKAVEHTLVTAISTSADTSGEGPVPG